MLRVGLGIAALLLLFHFVKLDDVGSVLQTAAGMGVAIAVLLNFATRCVAAARSFALSHAANLPVSYLHTLQALFISNFWSLALPGVSAGSVATVWRYHGHGASVMQSVAVLAASRIVELVAFCSLALLGLATSVSNIYVSRSWAAALLVAVIAVVGLGLLILKRLTTPNVVAASADAIASGGTIQRARAAAGAAVGLLRSLPGGALSQASGWALLQGVLDAATVTALAVALDIPIGLPQALWINALSYLAILLPISAAGLGLREAAVIAALVPLGIGRADALALALLMLAMTLLNALVGALLQLLTRRTAHQSTLDSASGQ